MQGTDTSDKKNPTRFCCNSDSFTSGFTRSIKLPCDSDDLTMTAEDEVDINNWSSVAVVNYSNSSIKVCYEMTGTTTKPTIKSINCTLNYTYY